MRKLILKMSISLDGFVAGTKSDIDWIFRSMDRGATDWTMESLWTTGLHIMGSRTFHDMASFWPSSTEVFAAPMNEIPKAVFSKDPSVTLPAKWTTTQAVRDASAAAAAPPVTKSLAEKQRSWTSARVMTGDLAEEIAKLKSEPGQDIMAHGGASFARSLVRLGLVDEYRLLMHPAARGVGLPLFSELPKPIALHLASATAFDAGAVALVYQPARTLKA
jgi:dihydrofolate reductase